MPWLTTPRIWRASMREPLARASGCPAGRTDSLARRSTLGAPQTTVSGVAGAVVHLGQADLVALGSGCGADLEHARDDERRQLGVQRLDRVDRRAEHGQAVGDVARRRARGGGSPRASGGRRSSAAPATRAAAATHCLQEPHVPVVAAAGCPARRSAAARSGAAPCRTPSRCSAPDRGRTFSSTARMHHPAAEDLHPAGALARGAAAAVAELALDVHLGRRLGEREERGPEARLRRRARRTGGRSGSASP